MIKKIFNHYRPIYLVTIISILLTASGLRAQESSASETFSDSTKDFLFNPAQAGSLLGTIFAGAAIANPLAPLLGSVAGFFIGKSTDYTDRQSNGQQYAYINRSLIPKDSIQVASLSGLTGKQPQGPEQTVIRGLPLETSTRSKLVEIEPTVVPGLAREIAKVNQLAEIEQSANTNLTRGTEMGSTIQQQIALACTQIDLTQPIPLNCYYFSQ
jgi:hypothetical protein